MNKDKKINFKIPEYKNQNKSNKNNFNNSMNLKEVSF